MSNPDFNPEDLQTIFDVIREAYYAGFIAINDLGEIEILYDIYTQSNRGIIIHKAKMPHVLHHNPCNTVIPIDTIRGNRCPYCHQVIPQADLIYIGCAS